MATSASTSADPPRVNLLGVGINAVDLEGAVVRLLASARVGRRGYVCVTGAHGVIESRHDPDLCDIHNRSLLTVPDGMPVVWMCRWLGHARIGRVYGPDLMASVIREGGTEFSHFLCGTDEPTLKCLGVRLGERFPGVRIAGTFSPPFGPWSVAQEEELIARVAEARPDFLWVGMSTPRQEQFMAAFAPQLAAGILVGVGAAFDLHAGKRTDAPDWMKRSGFQWLHRLIQEPKRLGPRYLRIVPLFLWLSLLQRLGLLQAVEPGRHR